MKTFKQEIDSVDAHLGITNERANEFHKLLKEYCVNHTIGEVITLIAPDIKSEEEAFLVGYIFGYNQGRKK